MYAIGCVLRSLDFANFLDILCREARPRFRSMPRLAKWKMPNATAGSAGWSRERMRSYWATALRRQLPHHQGEEALMQADGWCHDLQLTLDDAGSRQRPRSGGKAAACGRSRPSQRRWRAWGSSGAREPGGAWREGSVRVLQVVRGVAP